jgi:catechol 2,3-dioxygenase-like lactoylglutathione lyase family enzyme
MLGRRFVPICVLALGARQVVAQVAVVGPSFAALSVPDLAASVRWYRDVFGLSIVFEAAAPDSATKVVLLAGAGLRIELVWHQNARPLSSYAGGPTQPDMVFGAPKIGFFVRDIDSAIAVLRTQRATIEGTWLVRPPQIPASDTLWTRNILVRDNSGTYVQLFERRP